MIFLPHGCSYWIVLWTQETVRAFWLSHLYLPVSSVSSSVAFLKRASHPLPSPSLWPVSALSYSVLGTRLERCWGFSSLLLVRVPLLPQSEAEDSPYQLLCAVSDLCFRKPSSSCTREQWVAGEGERRGWASGFYVCTEGLIQKKRKKLIDEWMGRWV